VLNDSPHLSPKTRPLSVDARSLPDKADVLTREAACDNLDRPDFIIPLAAADAVTFSEVHAVTLAPGFFSAAVAFGVFMGKSVNISDIGYSPHLRKILFEHLAAEWINFNLPNCLDSRPLKTKIESSDPCE